jgi:Carboxypeptidase regulatory-like domain/TonB dependent receptor/TonB-dependent Receptor Plug Domain
MKRGYSLIFSTLMLVFCLTASAFGQETTGSIEVTVKDSAGAVVPNAAITISSSAGAGFRRTATTDSSGFQRVLQVPPGIYTVTIGATGGFAERRIDNINVVLGRSTPVSVEVGASVGAVVDVTGNESPIDTTDTKIQTNISAQDAELLPKGVNFSSLLKIAPAVRPEPLTGGFQIDGASGSENTYIVDGQEVTNAFSGTLPTNNNLPFQLIQEIQVKSSGFEAEYGGATGGVVNLVTKGGNNDFHGEFGFQMRPDQLQARPRPSLNLNSGIVRQLPDTTSTLGFFPTATFSGPIIKDRAWFFGSYTPQVFSQRRPITYRSGASGQPSALGTLEYRAKQKNEYAFARFDIQPISKIRLTGSYTYNPIIQTGELPAITTQFNAALPNGNGLSGVAYQDQLGGRQNSTNATGQAVWTPTSNLVLSVRGGHNFINTKLATYGRPVATAVTSITCDQNSLVIPANAGCTAGAGNGITRFASTAFDATKRNTLDADATFITSLLGRHEFKGGYQYNGLSNDVLSATVNGITLTYGRDIVNVAGRSLTISPTAIGAGEYTRNAIAGSVSSKNEGLYLQDKYQPINRLTINAGVRIERENVPSYNPGASDLQFNFGSKVAPRIGVAYDLTGDGKTKISGFFGRFYDRFKYTLPRGSFGGDLFYRDFFEIFPNDPPAFQFTESLINSGGLVNSVLGSCPNTGFVYGRVRCSINARVASNAGLPVDVAGGIDPDIKPYRQSEMTFTFERQLNDKFVVQGRYVRKRLDRAIEDIGFFNAQGSEVYIIGNPGEGAAKAQREAQGLRPDKAIRRYDAFEIRLDRRFANSYYFNANYTYSRLYGNFSGLASSDEAAVSATGSGRTDPNVSRYFDAPFTEAVLAGGESIGRLATDRPHVFKIAAAYDLDWQQRFGFGGSNSTSLQGFYSASSGTPLTTVGNIAGYTTIIVNGRGDLGRTEMLSSTDLALRHRYRFGRDNRFTLVAEADVLNVFNQNSVVSIFAQRSISTFALDTPANGLVSQAEINAFDAQFPPVNGERSEQSTAASLRLAQQRLQRNGAPVIVSKINAENNPRFLQPTAFQPQREFRFGFRLLF